MPAVRIVTHDACNRDGRRHTSVTSVLCRSDDDIDVVMPGQGALCVQKLGRGVAWLDIGTHASRQQASNFVPTLQERQGVLVSCPEESTYRMGYITGEELTRQIPPIQKSEYGTCLLRLLQHEGVQE